MDSRKLSRTDLEVSRACLGTMTFGSQVDKAEAQRMVDMCIDSGVNFFDTANVYNQGASEEILGRVRGEQRKDVIVATKVRGKMQRPSEYEGLSKESIRLALEHSLRRLGTDYIDLYYLHQPDYKTPIEETLETMDALRREGKIRYTGASNFSGWQLCEMHWVCERNGWQSPLVSQPMYNLLARGIEQEYLSFTRRFEVANVCYNPLAGGFLTGKQSQEKGPLANTRFDGNAMYLNRYWHKQYFDAVEELRGIANDAGLTLVQLAIAWLMRGPGADCLILGASSVEQLGENLAAMQSTGLAPEAVGLESAPGALACL
jgi:aryl-alcohol dehydrogenase-like predicted oxidoreductase